MMKGTARRPREVPRKAAWQIVFTQRHAIQAPHFRPTRLSRGSSLALLARAVYRAEPPRLLVDRTPARRQQRQSLGRAALRCVETFIAMKAS